MDDERARELFDAIGGSDWWFDGWDIFHKPTGLNLDQMIVTRGPRGAHYDDETMTDAILRLCVLAVNRLRAELRDVD